MNERMQKSLLGRGWFYMKKIGTNIHEQATLARINLAQRTPR
jgi:hypothetical protein